MEKTIFKNFSFTSQGNLDSYKWSCPDLVGYYEATIHSAWCSYPSYYDVLFLNSPQIVNAIQNNSTMGSIVNYAGYNYNITTSNYISLGKSNQNQLMLQNLKVIMRFNGEFFTEFIILDEQQGTNNLYRTSYSKYSITMSLRPYNPHPDYKVGVNPTIKNPNRKMITIYNPAETSYINKEIGLYGKYKVTPILSYYDGGWPENVGISIYSTQFSTTIPNNKRLYIQSCDQNINRGQVFHPYVPLEAEFCGYIDLRFYSVQNSTEEPVQHFFLQLMCERI